MEAKLVIVFFANCVKCMSYDGTPPYGFYASSPMLTMGRNVCRNAFEMVLCYTASISAQRKVECMDTGRKETATEMNTAAISHMSLPPTSSDTRLRGWRLFVARLLVFTALAVTTALFVLALPESLTHLATPCANPVDQCLIGPAQVAPLARLGLTPLALAVAAVALSCLVVLLVDGVAAVLIWRRSNDGMALLVALTLILAPMAFTPVLHVLPWRTGVLQGPAGILSAASSLTILLLLVLFPSGRFMPRWLWIPSLVLVISTLAIVALFQPIRERIQAFIDRRFYRQKYNAEKALAAFSATLRNEVDLEHLREQLLAVVQETMQPASLSVCVLPVKQRTSEEETRGESLSRGGWLSAERSDSQ
jgi:hypothetical protein